MALAPSELHALSRKYALLGELRRRHDPQPPAELGPLAREFPGALRELDALPLEEIDRRFGSVELALQGGPTEALLEWVAGYHELMRAALSLKRRLRGRREISGDEAAALADAVWRELGVRCDVEFVVQVGRPPGGRLSELVLSRLASAFGVSVGRLRSALFSDVI